MNIVTIKVRSIPTVIKNAFLNDGFTSFTTPDCVDRMNVTIKLISSPNNEFGTGVPIGAQS